MYETFDTRQGGVYSQPDAMRQKLAHEAHHNCGVVPLEIKSLGVVEVPGLVQFMSDQWAKRLECMLCRLDSVIQKSERYRI